MMNLYILAAILLLSSPKGCGQQYPDSRSANETITGEWILYPNTKEDTLNLVRHEILNELGYHQRDLNPLERWIFNADHSGLTYREFSNFNTVSGILTCDDEAVSADTINGEIRTIMHKRQSGCIAEKTQWKISGRNLLTLNGDKPEYRIVALTDKRLTVVEITP